MKDIELMEILNYLVNIIRVLIRIAIRIMNYERDRERESKKFSYQSLISYLKWIHDHDEKIEFVDKTFCHRHHNKMNNNQ